MQEGEEKHRSKYQCDRPSPEEYQGKQEIMCRVFCQELVEKLSVELGLWEPLVKPQG